MTYNHFQHVLYSVLSIHGEILRIVIYRKFGQLRAFVEYPFSSLIFYLYLLLFKAKMNVIILNFFLNYSTVHTFSKEEFATKVFGESNYIILDYISLKAEYAKVCILNLN